MRFGRYDFEPAARRVTHSGQPVHLTPKAFDLLHLLIDAAPRCVSKQEIHDRLWQDHVVSDATLVGLVKELRR
ncbi:MAG: winged helix-turn-helix domain-containing protein, partial [Gammaproteobacteria bacterium]